MTRRRTAIVAAYAGIVAVLLGLGTQVLHVGWLVNWLWTHAEADHGWLGQAVWDLLAHGTSHLLDAFGLVAACCGAVGGLALASVAVALWVVAVPLVKLQGAAFDWFITAYVAVAAGAALAFRRASRVAIGIDGVYVGEAASTRFFAYRDIDEVRAAVRIWSCCATGGWCCASSSVVTTRGGATRCSHASPKPSRAPGAARHAEPRRSCSR